MFNFLRGGDEISAMAAATSVNYGSANDHFLFGSWAVLYSVDRD